MKFAFMPPARQRAHTYPPRQALALFPGLLVLCLASLLAACASVDPSTVQSGPAKAAENLVSANGYFLKPASTWQFNFSLLSPAILGTQIDIKLLEANGFEAWRIHRQKQLRDVQAVAIRFDTQIMKGQADRQSGMLYLPAARSDRVQNLPLVIWCKGTELRRDAVPSRDGGVEAVYAASCASLGYAVWMPDYAGMGDSPGIQTYLVPESLAYSAVDGLRAARQYISQNRDFYRESGELAIIGYSEGGISALSAMRYVADNPGSVSGLRLGTVFSMAAPYALLTDDGGGISEDTAISHPQFLILMFLGWSRAYPDEVKPQDIFRQTIIQNVLPLFDGKLGGDAVHQAICQLTGRKSGQVRYRDLFQAEFLEALIHDPQSLPSFRVRRANKLDQVLPPPETRLILAASPYDHLVNPANSSDYFSWLQSTRARDQVEFISLGSPNHYAAGGEALLYALLRLDWLQKSPPQKP